MNRNEKFAANLNLKGHQFFLTHPVQDNITKTFEVDAIYIFNEKSINVVLD